MRKDLLLVQATDSLAFITSLKAKNLSDASIRAAFHSLRSMYGVLFDMGMMQFNPFRQIGRTINLRSRREVRPTKMIPFNKVFKLMASCDKTPQGIRDRAMLACIFGGGLRRSEVQQLNIGDIRASAKGLYVLVLRNTKAGKIQEQVLPKWASRWVFEYCSQRLERKRGPTDPLFIFMYKDGRERNVRIAVETIYRTYKRYLKKISIDAGPHSGRATAASRLKALGFEDREVAGFLRHSTISQVQVYDKRFNQSLRVVGKKLRY